LEVTMLRLALLSTALAGVRAFTDATAKANDAETDLKQEPGSNFTSFRASRSDSADSSAAAADYWRLKPNYGSPYLCDVSLYNWFTKLANESGKHEKMTILDVGGGYGEKGDMIEKMHPNNFKYTCIDVTSQGRCTEFDGNKIHHGDRSFDVVTFIYSFHHAGDAVFSLLREAKRIARKYVVVLDDLMGLTDHTLNFQFGHGGCQQTKDEPRVCSFRTDREYREIFGLMGLRIAYAADVMELFKCEMNYKIPRGLYVLEPNGPTESSMQFLSSEEQRSFRLRSGSQTLAPVS